MSDEPGAAQPLGDAPPARTWWRRRPFVLALALSLAAVAAGLIVLLPRADPGATGTPDAPGLAHRPVQISAVLAAQGVAINKRDEAAWLATIDPSNTELVQSFRRFYATLVALDATSWTYALGDDFGAIAALDSTPASFDVSVRFGVCWQRAFCGTPTFTVPPERLPLMDGFVAKVTWRLVSGTYLISDVNVQGESDTTPSPWVTTPMRAAAGSRVTLFAAEESTLDLAALVVEADAAALVADKYVGRANPRRYAVYVARPAEWSTWFGGGPTDPFTVGYALFTSESDMVVMVKEHEFEPSTVNGLLRHEFGHVVTTLGTDEQIPDVLAEGLAEYIRWDGLPLDSYDRRSDVHSYFHRAGYEADIERLPVYGNDSLASSAAYGAAFYLWQCIEKTYGTNKMWEFVEYISFQPGGAAAAAPTVLDESWSDVKSQCLIYLRSQ